MKRSNVLFTLGSLEVYESWEMTMMDYVTSTNYEGVYWRDAGSPQGFGPFKDIYTAMTHYATLVKQFKGNRDLANNPPVADVIRVDFQQKKRVNGAIDDI